ncbi:hypothetical protein DN752_18295 [Echinicola strongylocentroti]|uniref:Uncharacterized protein n=1 Tax=Echinicola strongylocentroti TaxID=1795355 RepID=A0A2Z4ILD9_9BACT|nr:hypothetical protein DN752_18295 [Echinicola strongylocentroti]
MKSKNINRDIDFQQLICVFLTALGPKAESKKTVNRLILKQIKTTTPVHRGVGRLMHIPGLMAWPKKTVTATII